MLLLGAFAWRWETPSSRLSCPGEPGPLLSRLGSFLISAAWLVRFSSGTISGSLRRPFSSRVAEQGGCNVLRMPYRRRPHPATFLMASDSSANRSHVCAMLSRSFDAQHSWRARLGGHKFLLERDRSGAKADDGSLRKPVSRQALLVLRCLDGALRIRVPLMRTTRQRGRVFV